MSARVSEKYSSRRNGSTPTNEQVEVKWRIVNVDMTAANPEKDAKAALLSAAPATWPSEDSTTHLTLQEYHVEEVSSLLGIYDGVATYNRPDYSPKQTGETVFTFDTTGGTQNVKFSKSTVHKYPSASAPDLGGAINATDTDVSGVDITLPNFAFTATKYFAPTNVTQTYIGTLFGLTGTVNNATWTPTIDGITLSFQEGEALFMGATGSRRGKGDVEIGFHLAGSPNGTNLTVGGITGIAKKGWEYLWVRTKGGDAGSGANVIVAHQAQFVYVEKVYDEANFTGLGL